MFSAIRQQQQSVAVGPNVPRAGFSRAYRHYLHADDFVSTTTPANGTTPLKTYHDILLCAESTHANVPGIGSRPLITIHSEDRPLAAGDKRPGAPTKKWAVAELGPYVWITYATFCRLALAISKGLAPQLAVQGTFACIYSKTSAEWQLAAHACFAQSATICTAYESLGVDGLRHVIQETECSVIFLQPELTSTFIKCLKSHANVAGTAENSTLALKTVVLLSPVIESHDASTITAHTRRIETEARELLARDAPATLFVTSIKTLIDGESTTTREALAAATKPPSPSNLACIMYTSGSTGPPKGVMMTHANLVAAAASITVFAADLLRGPEDVYLAYLPSAHVMEFVLESTAMLNGVVIGYGSPRTLTDTMVRNCRGDMRELRPTLLIGVPSVWDAVVKGIMSKVGRTAMPIRWLFSAATALKRVATNALSGVPGSSLLVSALDVTLLRAIKDQVGGRLRQALSGGAPLSEKSQHLLCGALVPILQGYGLTETCASALAPIVPGPITIKSVGVPVPSVEVRLKDVPELGYFVADNVGELQIRGPSVFAGYFKRPELDPEAFESQAASENDSSSYRWFSTGDIARRDPKDGQFFIIDRVKNLIKLSNGEYVAVEGLESVLMLAPVVARVCVVARPTESRVLAVISPNPTEIQALMEQHAGKSGRDESAAAVVTWESRCAEINAASLAGAVNERAKSVYADILAQLAACARDAGLLTSSIPADIILSNVEWVPESGYVTAAMKLNRRHIEKLHESQIDLLFQKLKR